jgi:group I intron endonuclease
MQIYKITNLINGKVYVGQDSRDRENYFGSGVVIKSAIKKYGINNFKRDILQMCDTKDELNDAEILWIEKLNSQVPNGYNLAIGGHRIGSKKGSRLSDNAKLNIKRSWPMRKVKYKNELGTKNYDLTIKHLKEAFSGEGNPMYGKHHSEVTKQKMGVRKLGKNISNEHKKNIGEASKLNWQNEEYRNKQTQSRKGKVPWNKGIKWECKKLKGRIPWNKGLKTRSLL